MEADVSGYQRKVVTSAVRPAKRAYGETGIALRNGKTLPFVVKRSWSAPAGVYREQWFLVDPATREVIHEAPARERMIWGLQSLTEVSDEVREPLDIAAGKYVIVFALGGLKGGEVEVEVVESQVDRAA